MTKASLYPAVIIVSIILVVFAVNVFPVPGTDSIVFIPPALLFSKGQGLGSPLYYVTQFTDPTHTGRFNYYVPFYSLLLGMLSRIRPGIPAIFIFCSLFSATALLVYVRRMVKQLPATMGGFDKLLIILSLPYIATYMLPTVGRPENLTILLSLLVYIVYNYREAWNKLLYNVLLCTLFALILATQITCFYFIFLIFLCSEFLTGNDALRTAGINAVRAVAILVVFCVALALSPNGLIHTLTGIKLHISFVLTRTDNGPLLLLRYWFAAPLNFGFGCIFIVSCVYFLKDLREGTKGLPVANTGMIAALLLFTVSGFVKFVLYAAPAVYNVTEFILLLLLYAIPRLTSSRQSAGRQAARFFILLAFAGGSLFFLRSIILFVHYKNDGKDYAHAAPLANRIAQIYPGAYTTNSLWSLFYNPDSVKIYNGRNVKPGDIVIVQQVNHPFLEELKGRSTIIYDWNTGDDERFLGIRLADRPQGFGFVVCRVN